MCHLLTLPHSFIDDRPTGAPRDEEEANEAKISELGASCMREGADVKSSLAPAVGVADKRGLGEETCDVVAEIQVSGAGLEAGNLFLFFRTSRVVGS